MTMPVVPLPRNLVAKSIDFKLKSGWRYDERRGLFINSRGEEFAPPELPKQARVVYKVPSLARSPGEQLSQPERDLQRYMQVIVPATRKPSQMAQMLKSVQSWPWIEQAHLTPEISLPAPVRKKKA